MKKILLASAALALTAGYAAADVTVGGDARMGITNDGTDTLFNNRIRISFTAVGHTDGGLEFGGSIRAGNASSGESGQAGSVYIKGAFGTLTMGDVGNAGDDLVGQVTVIGYEDLSDTNTRGDLGWLAHDDTGVTYAYTSGPVTFEVASSQLNAENSLTSAAVKYAADTWSVAGSYENGNNGHQIAVKGTATFGATTVQLKLAQPSSTGKTSYATSVDYKMGATTLTAVYAHHVDATTYNSYGLGASYDLGGGAKVMGALVRDGSDATTYSDVGVTMSF